MRGWNEYGHEDTPRFRSVFDCDHFPGDLRHKLRQEEIMAHDERVWRDAKGGKLLETDYRHGYFVVGRFCSIEQLRQLRDAIDEALALRREQEEAACQKT